MEKKLKKIGWESIITSIFFALIGIIMIAIPDTTIKFISIVIGALFIFVGVLDIVNYYQISGEYDIFNYDFVYGIIAIIFGIFVIFFGEQISNAFSLLIGFWIIYNGIIKFVLSFKINNLDPKLGIIITILSLITMTCGIVILSCSNAVVVTLGFIILIYSIIELVQGFIYEKNISQLFKEMTNKKKKIIDIK